MASSTVATSNTSRKRARKSTPSSRRVWTPEEEFTLVDRLKELCVNGWRGDNETFRHSYATISLLKSRSGLGFQYSDGSILVDDPKAWDDLIKVDPYAKSMTFKKWPLFANWEEIFRKDGATEQSIEGPEVGVQEIEIIEAQEVANDMSFEFPIIVVDEDDALAKKEDHCSRGT
ncbi:hypothetical protein KY289_004510 [Solanum tuberosum]|nr:hypothetical protein KY289_004510 [Solanum tuberosum]